MRRRGGVAAANAPSLLANAVETTTDERVLRQVFDSLDLDGNGTLEGSEILAMSTRLGQDMSDAQCDEAMQAMDADGNGAVTFEEFKDYWLTNAGALLVSRSRLCCAHRRSHASVVINRVHRPCNAQTPATRRLSCLASPTSWT